MSIRSTLNNRLETLFACESIALLDCEWILQKCEKLRPRQHLPAEAFLSFQNDLEKDWSCVIVLSYMWLSKDHPDPINYSLRLVKKALSIFIGEDEKYGLFWDYASLFQAPRSKEQDALFDKGLEGIDFLYMHPDTIVFQITQLPDDTRGVINKTPYKLRGWPFAEFCWASLTKDFHAPPYDICKLSDATIYPDDMDRECATSTRTVILLPDEFDKQANNLKFTKRADDLPLVKRLYRQSFILLFQTVEDLHYSDLAWDESDGKHLIDVLCNGYAPLVRHLDLPGNKLTARFCQDLLPFLRSTTTLKSLNLSANPLGDEGVSIIAPVAHKLSTLILSNIGMTVSGCRALASAFQVQAPPLELRLSYNALQDEGVIALAAVFHRVRELDLANVGLTSVGCRLLVTSLNVQQDFDLFELDFSDNALGDDGVAALVPLLHKVTNVSLCNVGLADAGCQIIAAKGTETESKCTRLYISRNDIHTTEALMKLHLTFPNIEALV